LNARGAVDRSLLGPPNAAFFFTAGSHWCPLPSTVRRFLLLHRGQPLVPSSIACPVAPTTSITESRSPSATTPSPTYGVSLAAHRSAPVARPPWLASRRCLTLSEVPITRACSSTTPSPAPSRRSIRIASEPPRAGGERVFPLFYCGPKVPYGPGNLGRVGQGPRWTKPTAAMAFFIYPSNC
jgi:hypothetical protein